MNGDRQSHTTKDISEKVRSSFVAKRRRGEFVGAFSSCGYLMEPAITGKMGDAVRGGYMAAMEIV